MTDAPSEVINQQTRTLRRFVASSAEVTGRIAIRPVFVDDAGRRRRLIVGCGYLAALAAVGYIVIVGISLTAGPTGPLAAVADPQPPHPVEDMAQPTPVPFTSTSRAVIVARATTVQQPRSTRAASVVTAPTHPIVAPTTAPAPPPVIATTSVVPTDPPCRRRRGCATATPDPTTTTSADSAAAIPDAGPAQ